MAQRSKMTKSDKEERTRLRKLHRKSVNSAPMTVGRVTCIIKAASVPMSRHGTTWTGAFLTTIRSGSTTSWPGFSFDTKASTKFETGDATCPRISPSDDGAWLRLNGGSTQIIRKS